MAVANDSVIERRLIERFGTIEVLSRTPLDARTLDHLKLKPNEWVEWVPVGQR